MQTFMHLYKTKMVTDEELKLLEGLPFKYFKENKDSHDYLLLSTSSVEGNKLAYEDIRPYLRPISLTIRYVNIPEIIRDYGIPQNYVWYSTRQKGKLMEVYFRGKIYGNQDEKKIIMTRDEYEKYYTEQLKDYFIVHAEPIETNRTTSKFDIKTMQKHIPVSLNLKPYCKLSEEAIDALISLGCVTEEDIKLKPEEHLILNYFIL